MIEIRSEVFVVCRSLGVDECMHRASMNNVSLARSFFICMAFQKQYRNLTHFFFICFEFPNFPISPMISLSLPLLFSMTTQQNIAGVNQLSEIIMQFII
jgi:predicted benzoate:H+ symporter BenE